MNQDQYACLPAKERHMNRSIRTIAFALTLVVASSGVNAQFPIPVGPGFGGYGGFGPYGGGYYGYGGYGGLAAFGGYGPFNYSQQLFQQQASLTQQIFQQRQQAIIGQIRVAQGRLEGLDGIKQQLVQKYLEMGDSDKAAVRARLMTDYVSLDAQGREGWKRDGAIQTILGSDLARLNAAAQVREMDEPDRIRYRQAMLQKYLTLPASQQQAWRDDQIVGMIMGKDWWLK
jgi:hypothetical protein